MIRSSAISLLLLLLGAAAAVAGTLEVVTQPGVEVYWEGVLLATTDADGRLVVEDVPPGPFELTLRKEGFEELSTPVSIGDGSTRLSRELVPLAEAATAASAAHEPELRTDPVESADSHSTAVTESTAEPVSSGAPVAAPPEVRVSRGAWLAAIAAVGLAGVFAARSLRRMPPPTPHGATRSRKKSPVTRAPSEGKAEGGFLSELRQRERALDELVDVSSEGRRAEVPEPDVVDVAWKEVD